MSVSIVQHHDPLLRRKARPVSEEQFKDGTVQRTILDMQTALNGRDDGVAIAAPQIGVPLRIFVVSARIFAREKNTTLPPLTFINPRLVSVSKDTEPLEEGCLSVPNLYGRVERSQKATIEAQNSRGETFTLEAAGLLAHIFQHEMDHLEGVLFIDKARDVRDITKELHGK